MSDLLPPQTVSVRIVNGKFMPCQSCHWRGVCVVPLGNHFQSYCKDAVREYYQCEDYINKQPPRD